MKKDKIKTDITELKQLIKKYALSQPKLAELINMPLGTFQPKLNEKLPQYNFTASEYSLLLETINMMGEDLKVCSRKMARKHEKQIINNQKHEKLS